MIMNSRLSSVVAAVVILLMPLQLTAAPSGFTDYDIALQELNQVKKKKSVQRSPRRAKEQRREKKNTETVATVAAPSGEDKGRAAAPLHRAIPAPVESDSVSSGKSLAVTHDPFSFLVAGKRSTVQAVIETDHDTAAVQCRFRADNSSSWGRVPMKLVTDTRFTYRAVLPAAVQSASMVQYQFVAVDREGKETFSREYSVPVRPSLVVPGWQLDPGKESLPLTMERENDLLEGFSDPGVSPLKP